MKNKFYVVPTETVSQLLFRWHSGSIPKLLQSMNHFLTKMCKLRAQILASLFCFFLFFASVGNPPILWKCTSKSLECLLLFKSLPFKAIKDL